jgi:hypothetical protein
MSIYASSLMFDADNHADDCKRWVVCDCSGGLFSHDGPPRIGTDQHWVYDDADPCTCRCGPIEYRGSHILPSDDDPRDGVFNLGHIPGFIDREGRPPVNDEDEDYPCHPWLRMFVNAETVLLDRRQVAEVRDYLSYWLCHSVDSRSD